MPRGPGFCGCRAWKRSTACRPSSPAASSQVGHGNGSSVACSSRDTCIVSGRRRRTAYGVRRRGSAITSNGPRRQWSSLREGRRVTGEAGVDGAGHGSQVRCRVADAVNTVKRVRRWRGRSWGGNRRARARHGCRTVGRSEDGHGWERVGEGESKQSCRYLPHGHQLLVVDLAV